MAFALPPLQKNPGAQGAHAEPKENVPGMQAGEGEGEGEGLPLPVGSASARERDRRERRARAISQGSFPDEEHGRSGP